VRRVALKGLAFRKIRGVLTAIAIVLGVAMVSGAFVLTDTMQKAANSLESDSYAGIDAVVTGRALFDSDQDWQKTPPISQSYVSRVRRSPEVGIALGTVLDQGKLVDAKGDVIGSPPNFAVGINAARPGADRVNPLQLDSGRWPHGANEIAVDAGTAKREGLKVGQEIGIVPRGQTRTVRIVGLVTIGNVESLGTATVAALDLAAAQSLFGKPEQVDQVLAAGSSGVSGEQLRAALREGLDGNVQVQTASEADPFDFGGLKEFVRIIRIVLVAFGGLSLFVGAFIIFNTFSITVAQRSREFALLRTIGASRRQVLSSVVLEAAVIGLVATAVGIGLGVLIAIGLNALLRAFDLDLPQAGTVFALRTVLFSLVVGVGVSIVAGLIPAVRATRVPPVAIMREGATVPKSRYSRLGPVIATVAVVAGFGGLVYGMFADDIPIALRLSALGLGILVLFVGVALLAPRLVRPIAAVVGLPAAHLAGAPGRLARENTIRNPGRTATTAAALMIGIALVTFVSVLAQGMRETWGSTVDQQIGADYVLATDEGWDAFAPASADSLAGVEAVSSLRSGSVRAYDETTWLGGADASLTRFYDFEWLDGSDAALSDLGINGALVLEQFAEDNELGVGDSFTVQTVEERPYDLVVRAIHKPNGLDSLLPAVVVSTGAFDQLIARPRNQFAFVDVTPSTTRAVLEQSLAGYPDVKLQTEDEFIDSQTSWIGQMLNILYALLALSVLISFFGIVNTLVLSVVERTRELGMLRAVGMTRRQVRRMVRHESVITALIGTSLGIVLGIAIAVLVIARMSEYSQSVGGGGMQYSIPVQSLVVFALVAVLAGVLAAIMPARRASRLNVLEALAYE
jgi:putative ABC transport system permease protein